MDAKKKRIIIDYVIYTAVIAVGVILDQITKALAVTHLMDGSSVDFIPNLIGFTYVENRGMAWGLFADHRWVFMLISSIAILVLGVFLYMRKSPNRLYAVAISLLVSGGIGNMIDRIALGYVVDFIETLFMSFPVFNIADCFVTVGAFGLMILLIVDIIREGIKESRAKRSKGDGKEDGGK